MLNILKQFAKVIKGFLTAFDRVIIRGRLMPLTTDAGATSYAYNNHILFKDWKEYSEGVTRQITGHAEELCKKLGRPFINLDSQAERDRRKLSKERKEDRARKCLEENPLPEGCELICVMSATEPGKTFCIRGRGSGQLSLGLNNNGRCKHLYYYLMHKRYGFMYVKLMTWYPFTMEIYINGREALKKDFEEAGISYKTYDNCFTDISDVGKAQELSDAFAGEDHSAAFETLAELVNPCYGMLRKQVGEGYSWFMHQTEVATDIMFVDSGKLKNIYSSIVEFAFNCFSCKDIFRFFGKKFSNSYKDEVRSDFKERPEGCRWKAFMKSNSIKVYDKQSVLRVETTINYARFFTEKKGVFNKEGEFIKYEYVNLRKGISAMPRYLEIGKGCNERLISELDGVLPRGEAVKEIEKLSKRRMVDGRSVAGLNLMNAETYSILKVIASEDYSVQGFRNKDIAPRIYPGVKNKRKRSAKTSRLIRKLRTHGLVSKVPRASRYLVSKKGRMVIAALVEMKETMYPMAVEQVKLMAN